MPERRRRPTTTSAFGVSRRENHDASAFYERFAAPLVSTDAEVAVPAVTDRLVCGDARSMDDVADASVALVVTSPPYFAGKEYEAALGEGHVPASYAEYLTMLEDVFAECVRVLEPGGRIAVNVANLGRKPFRSLAADVTTILQDRLRLLLRGEVVWVKARGATGSCAWGSFQRPTNPVLRDLTERVVIAGKGRFDRARPARQRVKDGLPAEPTIGRDEFLEATTDVWEIPTESASRVGHPAPFPVELPERLLELYTYRGDLVLDPFVGSGSTAVAAVRTGRRYVGYDTDPGYVDAARRRVADEVARLAAAPATGPLPAGGSARDAALQAIEAAGFTAVEANVGVGAGVEVSFGALDARGRRWLFEVAGPFTTSRAGLRRADVLWRTLAKAAVVDEVDAAPGRFVVLTPASPAKGTPGDAALGALQGPRKPVRDVVVLTDGADLGRLAAYARGQRASS